MSGKKRSKSSTLWLKAYHEDPYVKQAKQEGRRSRSAYKLIEIQKKDHLIKPGDVVIDIGAAPGGWSEFAASCTQKKGRVIALDRLPIQPFEEKKGQQERCAIECLQADFTQTETLDTLLSLLNDAGADVILSDIAPNTSGIRKVDQLNAMQLVEEVLHFAVNVLNPTGTLFIKVFQGEGFDAYIRDMRQLFQKVVIRKPKASRPHSREVYVLARGLKQPI